jgi:hypothetical protein
MKRFLALVATLLFSLPIFAGDNAVSQDKIDLIRKQTQPEQYFRLVVFDFDIADNGKCLIPQSTSPTNCTGAFAIIYHHLYVGTPLFTTLTCRVDAETMGAASDVLTFNLVAYDTATGGFSEESPVSSDTIALDTYAEGDLYETRFDWTPTLESGTISVELNMTAASPAVFDLTCMLGVVY